MLICCSSDFVGHRYFEQQRAIEAIKIKQKGLCRDTQKRLEDNECKEREAEREAGQILLNGLKDSRL